MQMNGPRAAGHGRGTEAEWRNPGGRMAEKEGDRPVDVDIMRAAPEEIPAESGDHPAPVLTWVIAAAFVIGVAAVAYIEFRGPGQPASAPTSRDRALPPDAAANL